VTQTVVQLSGLDGVLDLLNKLPAEVVSKNGGPVRKAAFKGIKVLREQARTNFRAAVAMAGLTGITDTTGFTEKHIIAKRKAPRGGEKGERYILTVRPKAHPNGNKYRNRTIQTNDIAFIMEYGGSKQPATPWLRPAFAAKAEEAIRAVERELPKELDRIVRKLSKTGGGLG
jgi:hypothetical protein